MAKYDLLAILSLASLCYCINANLIHQICSKSTNPSLCTKSFRSDPRSRSADLRGLGQITINKARTATQVTQRVAKSLSTGDTKARADACVEYCADAIELLNDCSALLRDRSGRTIDDVKTKGSAALTDISTCEDEFGPEEPKKLRNVSRTTQELMDIFLVIANLL